MGELAKDDAHEPMFICIEAKGYKADALDEKLLANRWYEVAKSWTDVARVLCRRKQGIR